MSTSLRYGPRVGLGILVLSVATLFGCNVDTTNQARIRLLNVSQGYASLDLYVDNSKNATGITAGNISSYDVIDPTTHTVAITANGVAVSSPLQTLSESLSTASHKTYVAYGDTGKFATISVPEDQPAADSGYTKIEVVDAAPDAGAVDVYLTDAAVSLNDTSPNFSDISTASTLSFLSIASGTYRLRVTATGNKTDVRLDVSNLTFSSTQVASIILTDTSGGVLVNGVFLPQQGSPTAESNPYSRVRAAVGITNGTSVNTSIGGVSLLASAAAAGSVGTYQLVGTGSQAVSLTVDGTSVTVPNQTLTSGADYTLLVWASSSGPQATLLTDNNRLPTSGYANIRLVNSMSGLGDPLALAVDYTSEATDVTLGTASAYAQVVASTTTQLDVTDTTTSKSVFSQGSTTLASQGVYTLFLFGSSTTPTGTLRQDR